MVASDNIVVFDKDNKSVTPIDGRRTKKAISLGIPPNPAVTLLLRFTQGEARGRAIGLWAASGAIAGAVGPIIGGWLIDTVSWRVIFLINVPIALAAGIIASKYVRENVRESAQSLDWLGAVLATAALGLLTWSLTEATGGGLAAPILVWSSLAGLLLLLAFVWRESRLADAALMPLTLFASSTFVGLTLLTLLVYGSLGGLLVLLPFFLIRIAHWSGIAAGAALLPVPILIGLGSRLMGRVAARYGGRVPLTAGALLVGIGLALYARIDATGVSYWRDVFPATCLVALGMAMTAAPLTTSVMASVDTAHVGIASGFNSAVARIGGLVATALLGYLFARQGSTVEFVHGVKLAAGFGSTSALLAALCAYTLLKGARPPTSTSQ